MELGSYYNNLTFITSFKAPSPNTVILGVRASIYEFLGQHNSDCNINVQKLRYFVSKKTRIFIKS